MARQLRRRGTDDDLLSEGILEEKCLILFLVLVCFKFKSVMCGCSCKLARQECYYVCILMGIVITVYCLF